MHEYSIVEALVERVEREARARNAAAVHRLSVRIGVLSGVDVELLETAFATFSERTICHNAALHIERVSARWQCPECLQDVRAGSLLRCVECDAPARLASGDEIVLDRIEMEVP
jgi:hydrogenase nickel incorporation protein HypA/HybF